MMGWGSFLLFFLLLLLLLASFHRGKKVGEEREKIGPLEREEHWAQMERKWSFFFPFVFLLSDWRKMPKRARIFFLWENEYHDAVPRSKSKEFSLSLFCPLALPAVRWVIIVQSRGKLIPSPSWAFLKMLLLKEYTIPSFAAFSLLFRHHPDHRRPSCQSIHIFLLAFSPQKQKTKRRKVH